MQLDVLNPIDQIDDPSMHFMHEALDLENMQKHFEELRDVLPLAAKYRLKKIDVVRHKPGRRCLVEYTFRAPDRLKAEPITLIGKVRSRSLDRRTYNLMQTLWKGSADDSYQYVLRVPQPLAAIPEYHMWLQPKLDGKPLWEYLQGSDAARWGQLTAELIYTLHESRAETTRQHLMSDELSILQDRLTSLSHDRPELKQRLQKILVCCESLGETIPEPLIAGIHRDFYPDQVLVVGGEAVLLDLDLYCRGDVGLDIGNFIAHLQEYSLRLTGKHDRFHAAENAIIDHYISLCRREEVRTSIDVYTVLTLVRHIHISTLFTDRQAFTDRIVELCEYRLGIEN
jgi:hypothetical protein